MVGGAIGRSGAQAARSGREGAAGAGSAGTRAASPRERRARADLPRTKVHRPVQDRCGRRPSSYRNRRDRVVERLLRAQWRLARRRSAAAFGGQAIGHTQVPDKSWRIPGRTRCFPAPRFRTIKKERSHRHGLHERTRPMALRWSTCLAASSRWEIRTRRTTLPTK